MKRSPLWRRWLARYRVSRALDIWYHPRATLDVLGKTQRISGVQVDRAELCIGALAGEGLLRARDLRRPPMISAKDLLGFHGDAYLDETTTPERLARIFGLDPEGLPVQELLVAQRYAVGATLAAARWVLSGATTLSFHLGGGFHHAEPDQGSGFCVYNDIGVAIARLRLDGMTAPIAIVDLDYHQGNGNHVAFARDPSVLTFDLYGATWTHVEAIAHVGELLPDGIQDTEYLARLTALLRPALARHNPRLIFYVAGNDVLAGDRLGSFRLTPAGVLARDRAVVEAARALGAGLVVTLGGGYSDAAWRCTASFLRWLLSGETTSPDDGPLDLRMHYARIAREIDPRRLHGVPDGDFEIDFSDVLEGFDGAPRKHLLLDYYTASGVEYALERYGLMQKVRQRGFRALYLDIDTRHRDRQLIRLHGRKGDSSPHLLMELTLRRRNEPAPPGVEPSEALALLGLEWLLLQDPTIPFSLERPRLPGQEHPGLGIAIEVQEILIRACHRISLEGIWHRPAHYHVARVGARQFPFVDPEAQGRFLALRELLDAQDLAEATRWIEEGRVTLADGTPVLWQPADVILPVSERLRRYFESEAYREAAATAKQRYVDAGLQLRIPSHG